MYVSYQILRRASVNQSLFLFTWLKAFSHSINPTYVGKLYALRFAINSFIVKYNQYIIVLSGNHSLLSDMMFLRLDIILNIIAPK